MAAPPHLAGSDPDVQITDGDANPGTPTTVCFSATPPRAATRLEQEARSVVIRDTGMPAPNDPADVTETIRPRALTHSAFGKTVAWVEAHWVSLAIGMSIPLALLLAWTLFW